MDGSSFTVNITSNLKENEEAWVGYYEKKIAFAYIGCSINFTKPDVELPLTTYTPGLCYSKCNKSNGNYIGLNKGKCFCLRGKPRESVILPKCNILSNGTWIVGGGQEYISIYKRMNAEIMSQVRGNCIVFQDDQRNKGSEGCEFDYFVICEKGDRIFIANQNTNTFEWDRYRYTCPLSYKDKMMPSMVQASNHSWSNVRYSDVIYKHNETSELIGGDNSVKYGYITIHGSITLLSFTENVSITKRYLQIGPATKDPKDKQFNDSDVSIITIAVSVTVAVTVILVAAVIIIITLQRRRKIPRTCNEGPALNITTVNNMYFASRGAAYEQTVEGHGIEVEVNQDVREDNCHINQNAYCSLKQGTLESHKYDSL